MPQQMLTREEQVTWTLLASRGIANALSGLSQMIDRELKVTAFDIRRFQAKDIPSLLGGPENLVVGIYITVSGDASGHLMLIHEPKVAFELVDMQMGLLLGSTQHLKDVERSVIEEMGNITGSYFLNALADATNLTLTISPPVVMLDMVGAILGIALSEIMQRQDDIIAVKTTFGSSNQQVNGTFLVMPTMDFMKTLVKSAGYDNGNVN